MHAGVADGNRGRVNSEAPFGGDKQPGNGRECGKYGLEEFLGTKAVRG